MPIGNQPLDRNEKSLKAASLMKSLGKEQQFLKFSTTKMQKLQMLASIFGGKLLPLGNVLQFFNIAIQFAFS